MKGILSNILIFATGAAIGSVVTWKLIKDKYEESVREEARELRERFSATKPEIEPSESESEDNSEQESIKKVSNKPDLKEYAKILEKHQYALEKFNEKKEEIIEDESNEPIPSIYPIKPESFGDDEYDTQYLILYADGVLADDRDFPVEKVKETVGSDYENYFGVYEKDLVCIRNEELKTDYEICRDDRDYGEMYNTEHEEDTE